MNPEQLLGRYLRGLRLAHGWTLDDLSKKSGLAISSLSHIENGKRGISLKSICMIANAFDMSACTMLNDSEYQKLTKKQRRT